MRVDAVRTIREKLAQWLERAEELAESENQVTADRYADVPDNLSTAIDALDEIIDALE